MRIRISAAPVSLVLACFWLQAAQAEAAGVKPCAPASEPLAWLVTENAPGVCGGRLVISERSEPKTLNPLIAADGPSRELIGLLTADLIHINRATQRTEPALADWWKASPDGQEYTIHLRSGVRFSDGQPLTADDVVFSFLAYIDERNHAPQRSLLVIGDKPIGIRKLDTLTVRFTLAKPYAPAERLFDGFAVLPSHLLRARSERGELSTAWNLSTAPEAIAGLGPFRLKNFAPGERVVLERNPYYWKRDRGNHRLPYLDEIEVVVTGSADAEALRFASGELDIVSRLSPTDFAALSSGQNRGTYRVYDLGPGFEWSFLFFNLNSLDASHPAAMASSQGWFRRPQFRQAVSAAIDRDALIRLAYFGKAYALASQVTPGNMQWFDRSIQVQRRDVGRARNLLQNAGFTWDDKHRLRDESGKAVEFSVIHSASKPEQGEIATLIQHDLDEIGLRVRPAPLDFHDFLHRVFVSFDYEAALMTLADGDSDPNTEMNFWSSDGGTHVWGLKGGASSVSAWQKELDRLMQAQQTEMNPSRRKRLFDRVQQIVSENLPVICLLAPNILVAAKSRIGNFQPALLPSYTLWNAEQLYIRPQSGSDSHS